MVSHSAVQSKCQLVSISDGVARFGLGLETRLETYFCVSRSGRFQAASRSRSFQVSRHWILQRNGFLKFL